MSLKEPIVTYHQTEIAEPVPSSTREYKISAASMWRRVFKVTDRATKTPICTLTFAAPFEKWSMMLAVGDPKDSAAIVIAVANISLFRNVTQLVIGNPESATAQRFGLKLDSMWKHNKYAISLRLPSGEILEMQWKGTNEVSGFMKKMDRGFHHKLVEKESNRVLGRYIHNPWSMDIAGSVEVWECIPGVDRRWWDLFVLSSAIAIAEKNLKMVRMAMHAMEDNPGAFFDDTTPGSDCIIGNAPQDWNGFAGSASQDNTASAQSTSR